MILDGKIPAGPVNEKWTRRKQAMNLVSPANKRKDRVIDVGTGTRFEYASRVRSSNAVPSPMRRPKSPSTSET